jgi:N-terminal 7TM region of histidine kinase
MFIFTYTAAILSILCFGIAAFILFRNYRDLLSRYFGLYVFCVGIWVGANAMADISTTDFSYRFWAGMALLGGVFFISFYICFSEYFVTLKPLSRLKKFIIFAPTVFFSIFGFTKFYVLETILLVDAPSQNTMGLMNLPILLYMFGGLTYGLVKLAINISKTSYQKKQQSIYIAIGFIIILSSAAIASVIMPFFGEYRFYTAGPQFSIFMIALAGYAIFKHQLLNVKLIFQKSIIYTLTIAFVVGLYLILISTIPLWIDMSGSVLQPMIVTLLSVLISALSVPALLKLLKQKTDKIFFKDHVSYADAIHQLSAIMNLNLDMKTLVNGTIDALYGIFKPEKIKIYLIREKMIFARDGSPEITVIKDEDFELMPTNEDSLFINAEYDDANLAQVLVGEKKSGDVYLPEDRQIMTTFSYQFAMALQKTFLYEKLKQKNIELEQRLSNKA